VTIRAASAADVPAVLELWEAARSPAALTPDDPAAVERLAAEGSLIVAEHESAIVGAVVAGWDGWRGNVYRLAVVPEHRRRGLGLRLVRAAEESLRAKGARRVTALVAGEDLPAVGLWEAAGYDHDQVIARFVRNLD
jgi:ribosomal protein S18 acetylase RimI-like enzyme